MTFGHSQPCTLVVTTIVALIFCDRRMVVTTVVVSTDAKVRVPQGSGSLGKKQLSATCFFSFPRCFGDVMFCSLFLFYMHLLSNTGLIAWCGVHSNYQSVFARIKTHITDFKDHGQNTYRHPASMREKKESKEREKR